MTDHALLNFLETQCRSGATVHRDHLIRLFRLAGESYGCLYESEWWSTEPVVIEPMIARARTFLLTRREDAEQQYRAAWDRWRMSIALERSRLEREMERLRPLIAERLEDPNWIEFANSLPGFRVLRSRFLRPQARRHLRRDP